jgi:hypothetical protein
LPVGANRVGKGDVWNSIAFLGRLYVAVSIVSVSLALIVRVVIRLGEIGPREPTLRLATSACDERQYRNKARQTAPAWPFQHDEEVGYRR